MFWQEEAERDEQFVTPDNIVDLAFSVECRTLPVDHAYSLSQAIQGVLPWFGPDEGAGLHLIHGADSGNGWERPSGAEDLLYLSRRTKLTLRLPKHRVENARSLTGSTLDVDGNAMHVGEAKVVRLSTSATLYARYVVSPQGQAEDEFIAEAVRAMRDIGLQFKKVLAGKQQSLLLPDGPLYVRSLMVADLPQTDAVTLQEQGVGSHRELGCGVFIAHKSINKV